MSKIEESYVGFETARMLKEAGFDCVCRKWYEWKDGEAAGWGADADCNWNVDKNCYSRPTQALAARWLREVHRIVMDVAFVPPSVNGDVWQCFVGKMDDMVWAGDYELSDCKYATYEEAFEYGLKRGLELIKNKDYEEEN